MMSLKQIDEAASKVVALGVERIYLTGGEPLLHPDLLNILSFMAQKYNGVEIGLTTNGLLLSNEIMDSICSYGNIVVQISIDGATASTYEKIRGKDTYQKFLKGFNVFKESKLAKKTARTCVSAINYKEVKAIYEICHSAKIEPSFLFVTEMGNAKENWNKLNLTDAQKIFVVDKINALNKLYKVNVGSPIPAYKCNFTQLLDRDVDDYGEWGLQVQTTGQTSCCQFLYDHPIGNIFAESVEEMFKGAVFTGFLNTAKRRKEFYASTACKGCFLQHSCGYGCIGLSIQNGDATSFDGMCDFRRTYALFKGCNFIN